MALYKHSSFFTHSTNSGFDTISAPGTATPYSGIYRCAGCGRELVSEESKPFPPQNHHQHTIAQGTIRWRLVAYADHKPK